MRDFLEQDRCYGTLTTLSAERFDTLERVIVRREQHPAKWLDLRPTIQYIHQPGGIAHNTDDVIVGLRVLVLKATH